MATNSARTAITRAGDGRSRERRFMPRSVPGARCRDFREIPDATPSTRGRGDPQDAVVVAGRRAAAVAVAGEHVELAVGALDDVAQAAVLVVQQRLVAGDPRAVEVQAVQRLAAQRGEEVVAVPE